MIAHNNKSYKFQEMNFLSTCHQASMYMYSTVHVHAIQMYMYTNRSYTVHEKLEFFGVNCTDTISKHNYMYVYIAT